MQEPVQDYVGYAGKWPDFEWPGGARLALSVGVNYEEGAENLLSENGRREMGGEVPSSVPTEERDMYNESFYEYGSRVGVWRILDILREAGAPATFYVCGSALAKNPAVGKAIVDGGHEACGHGFRWQESHGMTEDEERESITSCLDVIERICGTRPVGWLSRYSSSVNTRRLLVEIGGFKYDMCAFNDDLPYYDSTFGSPILVIPYSLELNDARCWRGSMFDTDQLLSSFIHAFNRLLRESARTPKMMSIGLHCRIAGTPARAEAISRFLDHVNAHDGVWVARREEIADFWHANMGPA